MSIEAIKQLVKVLNLFGYDSGIVRFAPSKDVVDNAIAAGRQAIAEAEKQEPVAWRNAAIRVGEDLCSVGPFGYYDMTAEQWLNWALSVVTVHPPKREWVGLTDEEIHNTEGYQEDRALFRFAQAIEAKLRSKNI
jgi:hypothetical protein